MVESDHEYFERRANEERQAAAQAANEAVRAAHGELAERYADMARAMRPAGYRTPTDGNALGI